MIKIGIICEYNPFHNGHLYHLNKIKETFPNSIIILVMSGCFTQRGDISIINKYDKTKIALNNNINLIIELPFVYASQSADLFAQGAIKILDKLNVDYLIFGSELNNIDTFKELVEIQFNNNYDKKVKSYLNEGINYPTALSRALKDLSNISITKPNDLLALSYIKAIKLESSKIIPISIKRTNDFHSKELNNKIVSASAIRNAIIENKKIDSFVPKDVLNYLPNTNYDYFNYLKYKIISEKQNIKIYQTVDEGIENRILKYINNSNTTLQLINNIKTKRYTYNKISRMLIHILCSFTKEEAKDIKKIKYIRILGFDNMGQQYLNTIKKNISIPLVTNIKGYDELLKIDLRIEKIYNLITRNNSQYKPIKKEDLI